MSNPAPPVRFFLADVHLDGAPRPHALAFRGFLRRLAARCARQPQELHLLGDLFDFWDEYHPAALAPYEEDLAELESACRAGLRLFLLYGNRDFLYGRYARRRFGATLCGDGTAVQLSDGRRLWLEHGDLLCTGDRAYLRFRRWVRSAPVRAALRLLPWRLARPLIARVRADTARDSARKAREVFQMDLGAARRRLEQQHCHVLLCGHTHKPLAEDLGAGLRLLVLPAWPDSPGGLMEENGLLTPVRFGPDGRWEE
jgi:UDP-2,3-diacylglucosamine hydrolase